MVRHRIFSGCLFAAVTALAVAGSSERPARASSIATAPPAASQCDLSRPAMPGPVDPERAAGLLGIPDDIAVDQLFSVGAAYFRADRMPEAAAYFWKGASLGDVRATAALGSLYVAGFGVVIDTPKALFWLNKAAAGGSRAASYTLGRIYERGVGVTASPTRATDYFRTSADLGFGPAAKVLAVSYEFGLGVPRDRGLAIIWMQRAATDGDGDAPVFVAALQSPQAPSQFADQRALILFAGQLRMMRAATAPPVRSTTVRQASFRNAPSPQLQSQPQPQSLPFGTPTIQQSRPRPASVARSGSGGSRQTAARVALMRQSMGFGGIFGGMINSSLGPPTWNKGGGGGGGNPCEYYSDDAACSAHKNGDDWAADRLQNDPGQTPGSERDWYQ